MDPRLGRQSDRLASRQLDDQYLISASQTIGDGLMVLPPVGSAAVFSLTHASLPGEPGALA
jgi:hypothetical protein